MGCVNYNCVELNMKIDALKRRLFARASAEVTRQIRARGLSTEEILADFETWRKARRRAKHKKT
jgi:hypothetical protein